MNDPFPVYYSPEDIASRLGFHPGTVRRWIRAGDFGPADGILRIAGDLRVPWARVQEFLARHSLPAAGFSQPEARQIHERAPQPGVPARTVGELRRKLQEVPQS